MSFLSSPFYGFMLGVFVVYWLLQGRARPQNAVLLAASCWFYGSCSWPLLGLFLSVVTVSYCTALLPRKRWLLATEILLLIGLLSLFKYYNFFVGAFASLLGSFGFSASLPTLQLMLPLGISFYTFMALAYVIDVYKGKVAPERDFLRFAVFMMFFPQIAAGPIGRADKMLPQFAEGRQFDDALAADGLRQFIWGAFKKVVIADQIALLVDPVFAQTASASASGTLMTILFYSIQIYADFSAYSDMAIGVGKLFGIRLMRNFANPYFALNIGDFWRRWHISLTTWFRDYVYIPLGGNRCSKVRVVLNTMIVFLLSGLWHGASWSFVTWGGLHGLFMVPHIFRKGKGNAFSWLLTLVMVGVAWVFFRLPTFGEAVSFLRNIATGEWSPVPQAWADMIKYLVFMFCVEWINRNGEHGLSRIAPWRPIRWTAYFTLIWVVCLKYYAASNFIYFKF